MNKINFFCASLFSTVTNALFSTSVIEEGMQIIIRQLGGNIGFFV
jgi:hypothetical protein